MIIIMKMSEQSLRFNRGLLALREVFYTEGRLSDSNLKLDEVVKLLALEIARLHHPKSDIPSLRSLLEDDEARKPLVRRINTVLRKIGGYDEFQQVGGEPLLGRKPELILDESESGIVRHLAELVSESVEPISSAPGETAAFELLNEAFGHFVRDNFRNNIEDAQYLTPAEVVTLVCELAIERLSNQKRGAKDRIVVSDPSCGVGSFLAHFFRLVKYGRGFEKQDFSLVAQDKVDRMAKLAKMNLMLFNIPGFVVSRGNSILEESVLDKYRGRCDLILTNPPFGARFHTSDLRSDITRFPLLQEYIRTADCYLDSEVLFIDRYVDLLKEGGEFFAIVPDAVISARGVPLFLRERLMGVGELRSVIGLPPVTFAQAGTRTKTCILHFVKSAKQYRPAVFVATAETVGFEVRSRKGVPVRREVDDNDLPDIVATYRRFEGCETADTVTVLQEHPSCLAVPYEAVQQDGWTPNHYSAVRYKTLGQLSSLGSKPDYELVNLSDLVVFLKVPHSRLNDNADRKCISVLHIGDFGFLNVREVFLYQPKYPGQACKPGDIIFSRINPRIPRVTVVPDLGVPLTCSTEFEVMETRDHINAYAVTLLLFSEFAQKQIQALTSGTSSSHNRIKTKQLSEILLPVPKRGTKIAKNFDRLVAEFEKAEKQLHTASNSLFQSFRELESCFSRD